MYQINVAFKGSHIFRTDWIGQRDMAKSALTHLLEAFKGNEYKVTLVYTSPLQYHAEGTSATDIFAKLEQIMK